MEENIVWETRECGSKNGGKERLWYVGSGVLIILAISIATSNLLLGILGVIFGAVIILAGGKSPRKFKCAVETKGIKIDSVFHPYKELESFSMHKISQEEKYLILRPKRKIAVITKVPLPRNIDDKKISAILKKNLKEEEHKETLIETIARVIEF